MEYSWFLEIYNSYQTIVATITCGVFFKGARIGSPNKPLHNIPLAKTTSIVDNQHDKGCLREKACAPESNIRRTHKTSYTISSKRFCNVSCILVFHNGVQC